MSLVSFLNIQAPTPTLESLIHLSLSISKKLTAKIFLFRAFVCFKEGRNTLTLEVYRFQSCSEGPSFWSAVHVFDGSYSWFSQEAEAVSSKLFLLL